MKIAEIISVEILNDGEHYNKVTALMANDEKYVLTMKDKAIKQLGDLREQAENLKG